MRTGKACSGARAMPYRRGNLKSSQLPVCRTIWMQHRRRDAALLDMHRITDYHSVLCARPFGQTPNLHEILCGIICRKRSAGGIICRKCNGNWDALNVDRNNANAARNACAALHFELAWSACATASPRHCASSAGESNINRTGLLHLVRESHVADCAGV